MIYTITGATGNTGSIITEKLLNLGHEVRIVSRDEDKARFLTDQGAILFKGSQSDAGAMKESFEGADAVYAMIPVSTDSEDFTEQQVIQARSMSEAIDICNVSHVVSLSSVGAHLSEGSGLLLGLHKMEQLFNAIPDINIVHLRAAYFLENTLGQAALVKRMGVMGSPVKGDIQIPMVATKDVAEVAFEELRDLNFTGVNYRYVLGAKDYTYSDIARIYSKAIGIKNLKYMEFPYDQAEDAMIKQGMNQSMVQRMIEFIKALNDGRILEKVERTKSNTTPTTAEDFSEVFKIVYQEIV